MLDEWCLNATILLFTRLLIPGTSSWMVQSTKNSTKPIEASSSASELDWEAWGRCSEERRSLEWTTRGEETKPGYCSSENDENEWCTKWQLTEYGHERIGRPKHYSSPSFWLCRDRQNGMEGKRKEKLWGWCRFTPCGTTRRRGWRHHGNRKELAMAASRMPPVAAMEKLHPTREAQTSQNPRRAWMQAKNRHPRQRQGLRSEERTPAHPRTDWGRNCIEQPLHQSGDPF